MGGKTGRDTKLRSLVIYRLRSRFTDNTVYAAAFFFAVRDFAADLVIALFSTFALILAANSCLTAEAIASTFTLYCSAASPNTFAASCCNREASITTAYGKSAEGSSVLPRNQYVEIRQEKLTAKHQRDWPE